MSKVVYTIWESEDEGFRMPSPKNDDAFSSKKKALAAALKVSRGAEVTDWKRYQNDIGCPMGHGEIVAVFTDDKKLTSMKDVLAEVDGDADRLYAIDWTYVMGIKVV